MDGGEEEEAGQGGEVEGFGVADVQSADQDAAEGEGGVGGDEEGACGGGRPGADGNGVDGRVEEDTPSGGHEADGGDAGE